MRTINTTSLKYLNISNCMSYARQQQSPSNLAVPQGCQPHCISTALLDWFYRIARVTNEWYGDW